MGYTVTCHHIEAIVPVESSRVEGFALREMRIRGIVGIPCGDRELGTEPFIKTAHTRRAVVFLRLSPWPFSRIIRVHRPEVPFAKMTGSVVGIAQHLGQTNLVGS